MERPHINFSWTPTAGFVAFTLAGNNYPPAGARYAAPKTPDDTLITFTAATIALPGQNFLTYEWDFGDGSSATGQSTAHSYPYEVKEMQVSLTATDNRGRKYRVQKMINLVP